MGLEIDRLVNTGVLKPVKTSEFGTPIVPMPKDKNNLRVCGDYKVTLNKSLDWSLTDIPYRNRKTYS